MGLSTTKPHCLLTLQSIIRNSLNMLFGSYTTSIYWDGERIRLPISRALWPILGDASCFGGLRLQLWWAPFALCRDALVFLETASVLNP